MKKLIYLFLTVLIVGCSSGDDSNSAVTLNAQFVGSWLFEFDDGDGSVVIIFNADGTGIATETGEDGDLFNWSTTSTQLTTTTLPDGETYVEEYDFITNDQVRLIDIEDGETVILNRIAD